AVAQYVIVWEFRVTADKEAEFIEKYDPEGTWARFFRNGEGYIRTELVRDLADPRRFLTLDYWQSQSGFKSFREQKWAEYEELENITETETRLGSFWLGIKG